MTYEYINRQVFGNNTYYDLIITADGWSERVSNVKVLEENMESLAESIYAAIAARRLSTANRAYLYQVFEMVRTKALEKINLGVVTVEGLLGLNTIINENLGFIGVNIESPDLKNILSMRIESTLLKIKDKYDTANVDNSVKASTMAAVALLSSALD